MKLVAGPTLELPARHQAAGRLLVLRGHCLRLSQSRHFGNAGLMSPPEGPMTHSSTPGKPHWCRARGPGLLPSVLCFSGRLCFSGNIFQRGLFQIGRFLKYLVVFGSPLSCKSEVQKYQRGQDLLTAEQRNFSINVIPKY